MSNETLQAGDWVLTDAGEIGIVIHVTRLTAFLQVEGDAPDATVRSYLLSELRKTNPPSRVTGES